MSSTKEVKPPQDGCSLKSAEIDLLQSRFAALSHVVATSPTRHSTHHPTTTTTPVRRLGKVPETCLDHHTPPYGDEDAVRKRQRGSQEMAEYALGDKSLPSVRESSTFLEVTPFASSFSNTLVETTFSPIPITLDTEASVLLPFPRTLRSSRREGKTRVKKKPSAAMIFLGHFEEASAAQESERDEDLDANSLIAEQTLVFDTIGSELKEKNKDIGMVHGVREPEEVQTRIGPITTEHFVERLDTSATVSEELPRIAIGKTPVFKAEDQHFKELPEVVLTRYPRMAKYLSTLPTPEVVPAPEPLREKITWPIARIPPQEIDEDGVRTTESESPVDVTPEGGITKSGDGAKTPIFELIPRKSRRKAVRVQGNTVESKNLPTINLPDIEPVKPVSQRPRLPERYAIPVTSRASESAAQNPTDILGHGVLETGRTKEELLMEQLALIDERFSRESVAHPDDEMPVFSLSHTGSSAETNIRSSTSPAVGETSITARNMSTQANTSPQTPKKSDEVGLEDPERFRRSMGPSPSPHTTHVGDIPTTSSAENFSGGLTNNTGTGKGGQKTAEWAITAGNWLNKFAGSTKPTPALQLRSKPSVLARMHSATSSTSANGEMNTADTDDVAPGEWIKPVGLNKKPVKPKIGITAELAPLLFQPTPAPIVRSMVETVAVNATGGAHQWTKVVANQSNNQYSKSIFPEPGTHIERAALDVTRLGSNTTKTSSVGPTIEAEESARAKEKEKVVMEWRDRGFTEVGRMGETGSPALDKKQVGEQMQKQSGAAVFRSDSSESGVGGSVRFGEKRWITPREGGLFASPPRVQPVNRKAQEARMTSRDPSPVGVRNRVVFGRGTSPVPIQSPVRQQEQQPVDPNVQELANILKTLQTTQPKASAKSIKANDSFAKSWQNFFPAQAPKGSQAPISQAPVAREVLVVSPMPAVRQTPIVSQAPVARQTPLAREASRAPAASITPLAPSTGPRRLVDVAPPAPSAYSGNFVDRRFATPEVFRKEAMTRAEKEKERNEALEALIKQSRDEADKKCYDSGSATRMKNPNIRVAAGITVGKNAKGEMDWIISNPPPQPKPTPSPDKPNDGSGGSIRARKHHR